MDLTFLSIVTDLELGASQAVKTILLTVLLAGGLINLLWAYRATTSRKRASRIMIALFLMIVSAPVIKWYDIEGNLLNNPKYTIGTTLDFCDEFAKGVGVEFTYVVDGIEYRNCNTYHPIKREEFVVPGGKYKVRYSDKYPGKGRIDFKKPAKK